MLALTLHRPWPWTFFHAGKLVENRVWPAPKWAIGDTIAMHAGKTLDMEAIAVMREGRFNDAARAVPVTGHPTGVVGTFRLVGETEVGSSEWAFGPYCWLVGEVVEFASPVPCRGHQKLWRLPYDVKVDVLKQLAPAAVLEAQR